MTLSFEPYIGVPPLIFGMSMKEAVAILGEPQARQISTYGLAGQQLVYDEINLAFDTDERLFQIGFDRHYSGSLLFNDVDLLRHPDALKRLSEIDDKPYIWVGFILFMSLGIRLGGYHEQADEGRTISIFHRGRYDSKMPRFKSFDIDLEA